MKCVLGKHMPEWILWGAPSCWVIRGPAAATANIMVAGAAPRLYVANELKKDSLRLVDIAILWKPLDYLGG